MIILLQLCKKMPLYLEIDKYLGANDMMSGIYFKRVLAKKVKKEKMK